MKVNISCSGGTCRTLHLASQLDKKQVLRKLYVHMYGKKSKLGKRLFGSLADENQEIDINKIVTNLKFNIFWKIMGRTQIDKLLNIDTRLLYGKIIDRDVAKMIDRTADITVSESNFALETLKKTKDCGMVALLDRPNSHIKFQSRIVAEEYKRLGIEYTFNSNALIERALEEYEETDYICVLSSFVKKTFLGYGMPEEKLLVVPSGVNLDDFKSEKKKDKVFRIVTSAYFSVKKGTYYLLEAFRQLKLKNAELWIIGGVFEDMKTVFKKYEGLYNHIGFVPHDKLYKYFSQGSLFVSASIEEGLAKVVMEAMANSLPVIATPNTGAEDVIREGKDGFIIPVRNIGALKEKILFYYENQDQCVVMGKNARERVAEHFTWEAYGHRMIDAYRKVLKK